MTRRIKRRDINLPRVKFGAKFFLPVLSGLFFFATSCDEPNVVGLDVQPQGDLLHTVFSDTAKLTTYIKREDSIRTDETSLNILGSNYDPIFGKTAASIYSQFLLSTAAPNFGANPVTDSIVLSLVYDPNYYGTLDPQTLKVYQVTESFFADSAYYSNKELLRSSTDLANAYSFTPKPTDSVVVMGKKQKPQIRITLNNNFGQAFLNASGSADLADNTAFRNFFKGLYITTDNVQTSGQGALLYLRLTDALSKMTLYYKNDTNDSLTFDFTIASGAARFNHFDHDYTVAPVITAQLSDSTQGQNLVYLQPFSGLKTKIELPYIGNFNDSGAISVNKAELVLKIDPSSVTGYAPPANLVLVAADSLGRSVGIIDQLELYYGGAYNSATKEYRFNIQRHIQSLIETKTKDYGLHLLVSGSAVNGNRVVLGGGENSSYKMQLRLTYTKLY